MCQLELLFRYGRIKAIKLLSFLTPWRMMSFIKDKHFIAS